MKILFFFSGTGSNGSDYYRAIHHSIKHFDENTVLIFLKGCQHQNIGNSFISPDLSIASKKLRESFNKDNKTLNFQQLKKNFDSAIYKIEGEISNDCMPVDSIGLAGFSRGAISCLQSAQYLNDLDIPIDLFLNQPITGETENNKPLFEEVYDLSGCQTIRSAQILVGAYHNQMHPFALLYHHQMVPELPEHCEKNIFLLPLPDHMSGGYIPLPLKHLRLRLAEKGYIRQSTPHPLKKDRELNLIRNYQQRLLNTYRRLIHLPIIFYTPTCLRHKIYGHQKSIQYDSYYQKAIQCTALKSLPPVEQEERSINFKQGIAILMLDELKLSKVDWLPFILNDTPLSGAVCHFITEFHGLCNYLFHLGLDSQLQRQIQYVKQSQQTLKEFKNKIFGEMHHFLKDPSEKNSQKFISQFDQAASDLRKSSLDLSPEYMRIFLKLIVNFLSHISIIGLVGNGYHYHKTGNWLFFQQSRSSYSFSCFQKEQKQFTDSVLAESRPEMGVTPVKAG